jgi:hypothetical protein
VSVKFDDDGRDRDAFDDSDKLDDGDYNDVIFLCASDTDTRGAALRYATPLLMHRISTRRIHSTLQMLGHLTQAHALRTLMRITSPTRA